MIYWNLDRVINIRDCESDRFFCYREHIVIYKYPYIVLYGSKALSESTIRVYNLNDNSYNEYPASNTYYYGRPSNYLRLYFDEYFGGILVKDTTLIYPYIPLGSNVLQIRAFNWMTGNDVIIKSHTPSHEYASFEFIIIDNSVPLLLEYIPGRSTLKALNPVTFEVESTIMSVPYISTFGVLPYLFEVRDLSYIPSYYKIDSSKQPLLLSSFNVSTGTRFIMWNEDFSVYFFSNKKFVINYYDGNTAKYSLVDSGFSHASWKFIPISKNEFICVEDFFKHITLSNVLKSIAVRVSKPNSIVFDELKIIAPHGMPTPETSVAGLTSMGEIQQIICYRNGSYVKAPFIYNLKYWVT